MTLRSVGGVTKCTKKFRGVGSCTEHTFPVHVLCCRLETTLQLLFCFAVVMEEMRPEEELLAEDDDQSSLTIEEDAIGNVKDESNES